MNKCAYDPPDVSWRPRVRRKPHRDESNAEKSYGDEEMSIKSEEMSTAQGNIAAVTEGADGEKSKVVVVVAAAAAALP